ncbi:three-helix bundle dimerization domain-containing protein [Cellulomonas sp. McL0617]|uniref:three-helix bundle dimerization domain-containing protein n=1 Tax=Cellulomonas sp. McL0617 TaxID=3415675 RepID=UPI003CED983C
MPIEDEGHAIDEVVERLSARFPDVPESDVRAQVESHLTKFSGAAVRAFVPVLVEHEAGETLASHQVGGGGDPT